MGVWTNPSTKDTELDKEGFVKQLKKKVRLHGTITIWSIDEYEYGDFRLSRLVVESLFSQSLMERIITRFGNDDKFKTHPGQVLLVWPLTHVMPLYNKTLQAPRQDTIN